MLNPTVLQFFTKEAKKQQKESKAKERARKEGARNYAIARLAPLATLPFILPTINRDLSSSKGYTKEEAKNLVPDLAAEYDGDYKQIRNAYDYYGTDYGGKADLPQKQYLGPHYMEMGRPDGKGKIKNVSVGRNVEEAVLAHELGHATGTKTPFRAAMIAGRLAGGGAGIANAYNLGRMGLDRLGLVDDSASVDDRLGNIQTGLGVQALGHLGTLAEEARASKRALVSGAKRGKGIQYAKSLIPAYGTYLGAAAVPTTAYYGVKKYRETE